MFARWLFVRLHAAEKALREGRVDDAYAAAQQPDIRQHPRGQRLLDELVRPLVARARLHRQAGRLAEALADLDRLAALGRTPLEVETLRQQLRAELRADVERDARQQAAAARVADHLDAGRLETAAQKLPQVDDAEQRAALARELEVRVRRAREALAQAAAALERDDFLAAARLWEDACRNYGRTRETDAFAGQLAAAAARALPQWHREGKLDRLMAARDTLGALQPLAPALGEFERLISLGTRAVAQFSGADYAGLRQTLLRLKAAAGEAAWVDAALAAVDEIRGGHERLMMSPLGMFASTTERDERTSPLDGVRGPCPETAGRANDGAAAGTARLGRPLLLLVDGGGSALVIDSERVRLGRGGGSVAVEIPIPGDLQSHHADVVRRGDDYFLTAYGPTEVNRRRVEHTLLHDGDRIGLGGQVKMVFCKPSLKSESAVLRLSHRCRLPQDVSDVILFRGTCLIGAGPSCHLRTHEGDGQLVLFTRGGALFARQTAGRDWQSAPVQPIADGRTVEVGEIRVTVKPYVLS